MTTVQEATDNEAKRARQRAAHLTAAELYTHDLPTASMWTTEHSGVLYVDKARLDGDVDAAIADLTAWLNHLDISEYSESKTDESMEFSATGIYLDTTMTIKFSVHGLKRVKQPVKVRKVTV